MSNIHFGGNGNDYMTVTETIARFLHEEVTNHGKRCEGPLISLLISIDPGFGYQMSENMKKHPPIPYDNLSQEVKNEYIKRANLLISNLDDQRYIITTRAHFEELHKDKRHTNL
jgi:hypothetical protein